MHPHGGQAPPQQQHIQHFKRNNAFNDIFGRPAAPPIGQASHPHPLPPPPHQIQRPNSPPSAVPHYTLPHVGAGGPAHYNPSAGVGGAGRRPNGPGYGPSAVVDGGRPSSGQGGPRASSYYDHPTYAGGYSSMDPYAVTGAGQQYVQPVPGQGVPGRAPSVYGNAYTSPDMYQQASWPPAPQQPTLAQAHVPLPKRYSPASYNDQPLDYSQVQQQDGRPYSSPRQTYAPTLASGPPSASTSSHYPPTTRPNSSTSLQYSTSSTSSYASSNYAQSTGPSGMSTPNSSSVSSHPPPAAPPKLPEFAIQDDFFGFESARPQDSQRDSLESNWSGASSTSAGAYGQQLQQQRGDSPRSMYGADGVMLEQYDHAGGPGPSPRRTSLYLPSLAVAPGRVRARRRG
ncbi:hypothetical protein P7C70_g8670, partial [Phenoliferia sp. Uapishka_3]